MPSNQARVYVAAIQLGISPVCRVAKFSGVRREDTYRALSNLEKLGLIERIMDKPVKIRAVPAEEAVSVLVKHWKDTVDKKERELTVRREEFLRHLKTLKKSKLADEENHFALLLRRDHVIGRIRMMIRNAEREINVITSTRELLDILPDLAEAFTKTANKSVKLRIILEEPIDENRLTKSIGKYVSSNIEPDLRYAHRSLSHYLVIDYKHVLIATSPQPSIGELPYLWTDTATFAEVVQKNFEELWQTCVSN